MSGIEGITEQDIADYLANDPAFFERHAELLANVRISHPHGQRAVSLQERQAELLRDKIRGLENKIIEMIRNGQENVAIADRLHRWTLALVPLTTGAPAQPFGLLVLGSPDPTRYTAEMGTEFLARVGEIASAALSRLLDADPHAAPPVAPHVAAQPD